MKSAKNNPDRRLFSESSFTFFQAVETFLQHARIHGRSRKTFAMYEWTFRRFRDYVREDQPLEQVNTVMIRGYLSWLLTELNYRPVSLKMHYEVLHAFFVFAHHERLISANPLDGIPKPKTPKLFPFMLDETQIDALLHVANNSSVRNYAMLLVFLDCGLRLNELITVRLADVSLTQRSLKVHGKGAKDRIVFMGARTTKAVRRWVELRGFQMGNADTFFIDRKGEPFKKRWVHHIIARLGEKAGLKTPLSPHKLRHVSATLAVKHGMDAFTLQRLYGWENIQTAMRYVNAASPALREAHAKASPVDRLLGD